jgi:hypothetical protein
MSRRKRRPGSLLNHYRKMVRLRLEHPALAKGTFTSRKVTGADGDEVLAFERADGAGEAAGHRQSRRSRDSDLTLDPPVGSITRAIFPEGAATTSVRLAARSLVVYQLGPRGVEAQWSVNRALRGVRGQVASRAFDWDRLSTVPIRGPPFPVEFVSVACLGASLAAARAARSCWILVVLCMRSALPIDRANAVWDENQLLLE